jgi:hypothetical protein
MTTKTKPTYDAEKKTTTELIETIQDEALSMGLAKGLDIAIRVLQKRAGELFVTRHDMSAFTLRTMAEQLTVTKGVIQRKNTADHKPASEKARVELERRIGEQK